MEFSPALADTATSRSSEEDSPANAVRTVDCPTGTFDYDFATGRFEWSDQMYLIHGYGRGEVVPTLELGLAHLDPSERGWARELWDQLLIEMGPLAGYHTVVDTRGHRHQVLSVADRITHDGEVVGIRGFLTDITASVHEDSHRRANEAVARSAETRAVIEQAKGILMALQALTADEAFLALSRHSQHTHRKLNSISENLVAVSTDRATLESVARTICTEHSES